MENHLNQNYSLSRKSIHVGAWQNHQASEILFLAACINYTEIFFTNGRKLIVATPMKTLEKRFESSGHFFRTHKKYLVNLHYIKNTSQPNFEEFVEMKNDYRITIARRRKVAFENRLKQLNA